MNELIFYPLAGATFVLAAPLLLVLTWVFGQGLSRASARRQTVTAGTHGEAATPAVSPPAEGRPESGSAAPSDLSAKTMPPPAFRRIEGGEVRDLDESPDELPDFFNDLEALFRQTLAAKPRELDVRLKLLEICHTVGDADKFISEALVIRDILGDKPDQRWDMVRALGVRLLPDHPLFADSAGASRQASPEQSIARHYDVLDSDRAYRALQELKSRYLDLCQGQAGFPLLEPLFKILGEPAPLKTLTPAGEQTGARILVKDESRLSYHPIYVNARAQVLLAERLGYRKLVTAARSAAHALAVVQGVERASDPMSCTIHLDKSLAAAEPGLAEELRQRGVTVESAAADDPIDARVAAMQQMLAEHESHYYVCDLGGGPAPYPQIIRDGQAVIGIAAARQLQQAGMGRPDALVTCYESGQSAIGLLMPFVDHPDCAIYCSTQFIKHRGTGRAASREHIEMRSAREHAWLRAAGRVEYRELDEARVAVTGRRYALRLAGPNAQANARALTLVQDVARGLPQQARVLVLLAEHARPVNAAFSQLQDG